MALADFLKRKGPFGLPMPVVIVAGAGAAYYLYTRNQGAAADGTDQTDQSTGQGADSGSAFDPSSAGIPGSTTSYVTKNTYVTKGSGGIKHCPPGYHRVGNRCVRNRRRRPAGGRIAGRAGTSAGRAVAANR